MQLIDPSHSFYQPLWRRIAIVVVLVLWFAFEAFVSQSAMWAVIVGAVAVYTANVLLISWKGGQS